MQSFGQPFTLLPSVGSTNNYAMQMVHARMANHGAAWFALEQTEGKGQRGKTWLSKPGDNIMMSIVLEPYFLRPVQSFLLNAAISLGTYDFFKKYAGEDCCIKWPNDVYWRDRKAGGILIETVIRSQDWLFAVTGIGININQLYFTDLPNVVSLRQITGESYDVIALAKELCSFLENRYNEIKNGKEHLILQDYQQAMYKLNENVLLKHNDIKFDAVIKGISPEGLLIIETGNEQRKLAWGTVEWLMK